MLPGQRVRLYNEILVDHFKGSPDEQATIVLTYKD